MKSTPLFLVAGALTALGLTHTATAQVVGSDAFLKGTYLEVGISSCGTFGTTTAPPATGFHNNEPTLGFVADASQDGWGAGSPSFCGDFFVPGTPEEGWNLKFNGTVYSNHNVCEVADVPGSISSYSTANGLVTAGWKGSVAGMNVTKTTFFPQNALYFVTDVTLTNTTGATINDVYYMRNVDPDNEAPYTYDFSTLNSVVAQPSASNNFTALVKAVGLDYGCYLGLGTLDPRARVTHGGFANREPEEVYNGINLYTSGTRAADESISLSYSLGSLAPGQSVCFSYAYILNEGQLAVALQATSQPVFTANGTDITASGSVNTCAGSPVNLQIVGGNNYQWAWSPSAGLNTVYGTSVTANPAATTTYTLEGIGACGTFTKTLTVNVIPNSMTGSVATTGVCNGNDNGSATAAITGGQAPFSYAWATTPAATTQTVTDLAAGDYTVTVTDAAGCQFTTTGTVGASNITVAASVTGQVSAFGADDATATALATGGIAPYDYFWNTVPQLNEQNAFGLAPGTYTVTALDQAGCQGSATVVIDAPIGLVADITTGTLNGGYNIACAGGTTGYANLTVSNGTAPYTFAWSNGATTQNLTGLGAGTYTVTVTDANGQQATASVVLNAPDQAVQVTGTMQTYANGYNVSCHNGNNGAINLAVAGGTAPYSTYWNTGATTSSLGNLTAGTYTATVIDANGCEATTSFTLTQPGALTASAGSDANVQLGYPTNQNGQYSPNTPQCAALTGSASGGTAPYTYQWSSGANTPSVQVCPTSTSNYTLTVTDANGCQASDAALVNVTSVSCGNGNANKVLVCHSGNGNNWHNICISVNAVQAHLNHGCYLGTCNGTLRELETELTPVLELAAAPNPFRNLTTVSLKSSNAGPALVEVFDINGNLVQTLHNGQIESDMTYELEFNGEKLPAGLYMCRAIVDGETTVTKLVLMK